MISLAAGIAFVLLLFALLVYLPCEFPLERQRWERFKKQFPPISDEEFMALCPLGTSREVALKVRRIFADQLGIEYERIYPSSRIVDDLGAD